MRYATSYPTPSGGKWWSYAGSNGAAFRRRPPACKPESYPSVDGGAMRDRTADLLRAKQALSQLSYGPVTCLFLAWPCCSPQSVGHVLFVRSLLHSACALPVKKNPASPFLSGSCQSNQAPSCHPLIQPKLCAKFCRSRRSSAPHSLLCKWNSNAELQNLVGLGRFELPTSPLSGVRSNQLSYRPTGCCFRSDNL